MNRKKTTLFKLKHATSIPKMLVFVILLLLGNVQNATAQSSNFLASANPTSFFQTKNTFALKDVLTDIGEHYKVKIAYETRLIKDLSVDAYPSFVNQDVVVVLKKVLNEVNLDVEKVTETILVVKSKPIAVETTPLVSARKKKKQTQALDDQTITGVVRDVNNEGVPGVSVVLEGTAKGTITDMKGAYQISVAGGEAVLIFSSVGMETIREVVGSRTTIDVVMKDEAKALEMVVVSALGFTENRDKQGSASSKVDPKTVVRSGESGLLQGLAGKASGVRITRATGDPGAGSNFQIRGANTISGNSQPLIILDGIPISNANSLGFGSTATGVGVAQQSRLNDINPSDIETMQVLKGAAAAALWGSRAANGVLVITTKKGKSGRLQISYGMNYSVDQINAKHSQQSAYGQGASGLYNPTATNSWGDKIANRSGAADSFATSNERFVSDITGKTYSPIGRRGAAGLFMKNDKSTYVDQNFDAIFGNGTFLENTLTLSAGSERSRTFFSLGDLNQQGIIQQGSDYRRSTIRLNNDYIGNNLKLSTKAAYIHTTSNRIQENSNVSGLYLGLLRTPADFDNVDYKGTYYDAGGVPSLGRHRSYRRYLGSDPNPQFNNPEWTIKEQLAPNRVHRFLMSSELTILPKDWFDITIRGGLDGHFDTREYLFPIGTAGADRVVGSYQHENINDMEMNVDVIGRVTRRLTKDLNATAIIGYNINDRKRTNISIQSSNFLVNTNLRNVDNAANKTSNNSTLKTGSNRGYTTWSFDFKKQLSINATGAIEAASSFSNNFFYPSLDAAWRFNNLPLFKDKKWLSLGKLRASWGKVGVRPAAYRSATTYESVSYETYDDPLSPAFFGGGYRLDNSKGNPNLRPEIKTEWEIGTDLRFLENRLSISGTYYNNEIDVLLNVGRTPSSGFTSQYANAGLLTNKGMEADVNLEFFKKGDLTLNLYGNASKNVNKVVDLRGTPTIDLTGQAVSSRAVEGYPLGELWGPRALRDASDKFVLDANGYPLVDIESGILGDPNPRWRGGLGFSANYKKLDFNILFETSQGGVISQGTKSVMYNFGTHGDVGNEVTLTKEMKNVSGVVYPAGAVVRGNIGNFGGGDVILDEAWYISRGAGLGASAIREFFVGDATWTRLRELSLMYNINGKGFQKSTKLSSIQLGITGRNLFLWTPIKGFDPEVNQAGVGNGFGIEYFTNPSTRSILFSLKVNY
jgi:TonB-linked SusC/RagA family outer membrane protein